ncbi:MAG: hypothetical protein AAGE52_17795 [Myxococcota bacterium]
MNDESRLERAREHCFLAGVGDVGEQLCAANMPYGIAKIHAAQRALGLPEDATFVGAPDATVTRNTKRWEQGFGYGGRIRWTGDFAVLDIKSNGCGMLVGKLDETPAYDEVSKRAEILVRDGLEVEGIPIEYDLNEGNHFLDVCETAEGETYFVMHSSGHEHRGSSPFGCGMYYDKDPDLAARAQVIETAWGTLSILDGDDGRWFYESYAKIQRWNHARREAIASALFGAWTPVVNATHQGLTRINEAHLGCYVFDETDLAEGTVFPLTISADLPVFLVRPKRNFTEEVADRLGFLERAETHGVRQRILGANLLPHGGGYRYPHLRAVEEVLEDGPDQRRFAVRKEDGDRITLEHPRGEPFAYRGMEILECMNALKLGETVLSSEVRYVLRDRPQI